MNNNFYSDNFGATSRLTSPADAKNSGLKGRVLIVDDEPAMLIHTAELLKRNQFQTFTADNAEDALQEVRSRIFDLVICDINMPGTNGLEFLNQLKRIDPSIASVVITGDGRASMAVQAMKSGALGFVPKPFTASELVEAVNNAMQVAKAVRESVEMQLYTPLLESAVGALLNAMEAKDKDNEGHSQRVAQRATKLAAALGLGSEQIEAVNFGALFHDIGKIGIHDSILRKTGPLTPEEQAEMSKHPEIGAKIIGAVEGMTEAANIILHHHERYDGSGYPHGLAAETIPLGSRIVAVADVYEEIVADRHYSESRAPQEAIQELINGRGTQFDPLIVDLFVMQIKSELANAASTQALG